MAFDTKTAMSLTTREVESGATNIHDSVKVSFCSLFYRLHGKSMDKNLTHQTFGHIFLPFSKKISPFGLPRTAERPMHADAYI